MSKKPSLMVVRPKRPAPVLVCRKCLKRADDGGGIRRALKAELKRRAKIGGGRRARVVMTGCFDICPKHAVVAASAATLRRGEYVLLAGGGDAAAALDVLMPDEGGSM